MNQEAKTKGTDPVNFSSMSLKMEITENNCKVAVEEEYKISLNQVAESASWSPEVWF